MQLAFTKMATLFELEKKHGVNRGSGYIIDRACATFVDYIVDAKRVARYSVPAKAKRNFLASKLMAALTEVMSKTSYF